MSAILLIDDSASVREVLRVALEPEGYSVIEAADGLERVRLYREHGERVCGREWPPSRLLHGAPMEC